MHMHMRMENMHISIIIMLLSNFFMMLPPCVSIYERIIVSYTYAVNRLLQKIPDLSRCTKKQAKMRLLLNRLT